MPNFIGAVARDAWQKMGERPSVLDFGAAYDGATDNKAAFDLAIATGRAVKIPKGTGAYTLATAPAWPAAGSAMVVLDPGASLSGAGSFIPNPSVSALHFYKVDNLPASAAAGAGIINGFLSPALRIDVITQSGTCSASACPLLIYMPKILGISYTTTAQGITANVSAQSVLVVDSSVFIIGETSNIEFGLVNAEAVVVTDIPDSTHVKAIFAVNHPSGVKIGHLTKGDKIGMAVSIDCDAGNTSNIFGNNINLITRSAAYHTVDALEIDVTNDSGVAPGYYGGNAPFIIGMSMLPVGSQACTFGIYMVPGTALSGFLNGISIISAINNAISIGYGGAASVLNGVNVWNATDNGLIIGANQVTGDDPRLATKDPTIGILLTARTSYHPTDTESNKLRFQSLTSSVAHIIDLYEGQAGSGLRIDYDGAWTGVAVPGTGQIDGRVAFRLKHTSTNVDIGRFQNIGNSFPALYGGGADNALVFYSTVGGSGVKGWFGFYDNSADGNARVSLNTGNYTYQFRGVAPTLRVDGEASQVVTYALYSDEGSPVTATLKGRFVYYGSNSAGSKYVGIINDSADYIGLVGNVRITGTLTVGGILVVGLPDQSGHGGQFLKTNGTVADWAALAQSDIPAMFTDRGDPAAADKIASGLIIDSAFHDWDLSAIVPAGATSVLLRVVANNTSASATLLLRKNGNSNSANVTRLDTQVANIYVFADAVVPCDSNRIIEYYVANSGTWNITLTVAGWWK